MKRTTTLALFALICTIAPLSLLAQTDVAASITRLEYEWAAAQKAGDAAKIAPMLADTFVNTDVDGSVSGKAQLLSNLKGGKWEHNEISDVKVTVYGDTAIATGAWVGKGVDGDGTKVDRHERWTDAWVKMPDGKWQCVSSQQTALKK
ncbi:MAG: nuclear transport factor 2 family protein [Acidobacteriia bacterium]|nr:nuclear transport factor 2 family protein [Terriglobia bacterium]